jgi:cytochrome c5
LNYLITTLLLATPLLAKAEPSERQLKLLAVNCLSCHAPGHIGVPALGNADDWKTRNSKGEERLLRSVIEGMEGMPPSGYCAACDEADLRTLTRLVAGTEGGK